MKGILVRTDNTTELLEFEEPLEISLRKAVNGTRMYMYLDRLIKPYIICRNAGLKTPIEKNRIATYLNEHQSGQTCPVYGDIVILKHGEDYEPPIGLTDDDIEELALILDDVMQELDAKEKAALQCG